MGLSHLSGLYICHNICYECDVLCSINLVWSFNGVICFTGIVFLQSGFPDLEIGQEGNNMLKPGLFKDWAVKGYWKRARQEESL